MKKLFLLAFILFGQSMPTLANPPASDLVRVYQCDFLHQCNIQLPTNLTVKRSESQTNWEKQDASDKNAVEDRNKDFSLINLSIAVLMFLVAIVQAWFFRSQLKIMSQTTADSANAVRLSERPILKLENWAVHNVDAGIHPSVSFDLINSGRTMAELEEFKAGYGISNESNIPSLPPSGTEKDFPGILYPNGSVTLTVGFAEPLTQTEYDEILVGESLITTYGRIVLKDEYDWICEISYGWSHWYDVKNTKFSTSFVNRKNWNSIKWHQPHTYIKPARDIDFTKAISTPEAKVTSSTSDTVKVSSFEISASRAESSLTITVYGTNDQHIDVEFNGQSIIDLNQTINQAITSIPGLASRHGF